MARDTRTHYKILDITPEAQLHEVERAYRKLKAQMQDDTAAPDPRAALLIQTAYEILSDPARRAAYDEQLRAPRELLRRAMERRRRWIAGAVAVAAVVGIGTWLALRPDATPGPRDAGDILADASLAVGRVQLVEISGAATDIGLAFALDKGALATTCQGVKPGGQLVVNFAQHRVPARVAREGASICRLTADGLGSWPLKLRDSLPGRGEKVYGVRLDATGQAHLVEGSVRTVLTSDDGVQTIEVRGAAGQQPAGGPLIDAQGRVLGIAIGAGRYRPVPAQWMAELRAPPEDLPQPAPRHTAPARPPKEQPKDFNDEFNQQRAEALRKSLTVPDDI